MRPGPSRWSWAHRVGKGRAVSRVLVALLAVAAAIVVVGGAIRFFDDRAAPAIVISEPIDEATVVVAVEGAVAAPGVYELSADARYADAVAAAGGLTDDADLSGYNPARRVRDEERIVVAARAPARGSAATEFAAGEAPDDAGDGTLDVPTGSGLIDINAASVEELDSLPGIGPVLAERIVAAREEQGAFATVDDLAGINGISRRMVDTLRPLVTVGP